MAVLARGLYAPVATMSDLSIARLEARRYFVLPEWEELSRGHPRGLFGRPLWSRLWWEEFGTGKELFPMAITRTDEIVALVPLYRKLDQGRKILRFVGGIDLTDYLGPICALESNPDVADALVSWLLGNPGLWDEFDAHELPVPEGFADALVERADGAGLDFVIDQEDITAVLPLPSDWDSYLSGLDRKSRHELRRKRRRLFESHPDARVRRADGDSLDLDLKVFFEMHRGAEGYKGHFMKPQMASFFARIAYAFMDLGCLWLDFLEIGERPVASTFSFAVDGTVYVYNSAYEPDVARLSPGVVLISEVIRSAIDEGYEMLDLLRGPERYKFDLGCRPLPLHNVRIFKGTR